MKRTVPFAFALLALSSTVQAHQLWIEQPAGQNAQIRFGEFGDNLRETSPGLLDKFGGPTGTLLSSKGDKASDAVKNATGFALPFKAAQGESIVAEDAKYPLYKFKRGEQEMASWYYPAARLVTDFKAQEPRLTLDLVPTGKTGEFQLFFRGKPLPKAKVEFVTQSGWAKEAATDENGKVGFDMPWKGPYVAEVGHKEEVAGERPGANGAEKYTVVNYVTSVTYVNPKGLAAVPAGPAAPPNK